MTQENLPLQTEKPDPAALAERVEALERCVGHLLRQVGNVSTCGGCNAEIWWVTHLNGKRCPYDPDGTPHFATCPQADKFRGLGRSRR